MRKLVIVAVAAGLVAGALVAPAVAAKKKVKPHPVTFFFHGPFTAGELDYAETTANTLQSIPDGLQIMDTTKPSESAPDSMGITNYFIGANRNCNGNALFPTWEGKLTGKVTGDIKVYLNAVGVSTQVVVDLFADTTRGCTSTVTGASDYIDPVASVTGILAAGVNENELVIENVSFPATSHIVIMVTPAQIAVAGESRHEPTAHGRILYDAADYASRVEFLCTPTSGKSCIPKS